MLRTVFGISGAHRSEPPASGQMSDRQQERVDGVIPVPELSERMESPVARMEALDGEMLALGVSTDAHVTDGAAAGIDNAPSIDSDRYELYA